MVRTKMKPKTHSAHVNATAYGPTLERKGNPRDIEPETRNGDERNRVNDDDPCRKAASLDRAATAKLAQQQDGEDRRGDCTRHRPDDGPGDVKEVQKRGNQGQCRHQETAFDVEAHEAKVPLGDLASERTSQGDHHRRKAGE